MKTKKIKDWELVSKNKLEKNGTSTFRMQAGGGHIYLMLIQTDEGLKTETIFAPDVSIIVKGLAQTISDVKRAFEEVEAKRYQEGEYSPDIIPKDLRNVKKDLKNFKRREPKESIFPDCLPDNF